MKNLNLPVSIIEALNLLDNADCGLAYKAIYAYITSEGQEPADLPGNIRCILALLRPKLDAIIRRRKAAEQRRLEKQAPKPSSIYEAATEEKAADQPREFRPSTPPKKPEPQLSEDQIRKIQQERDQVRRELSVCDRPTPIRFSTPQTQACT